MKKHSKRFLSIALAVVLLFSSAPLSGLAGLELPSLFSFKAEAATYSGTCGENLTWTLDDSTGTLTISGTGEMTEFSSDLYVPWYHYRSSIKTVTINSSVTSISNYAFNSCASLTSITVDTNNQYYCNDEYGVLFDKSQTALIQYPIGNTRTSYIIPESVESIGDYAFYYCTNLTSITISDSVTIIGNSAFWACYSLTSIEIPESVTTIGYYAFGGCYNLTSIEIPDSVTTIGYYAFQHCNGLTSIEIPDSVTSIGAGAFEGCNGLTSIEIPESVTTIGYYAFDSCKNLASIKIPDSVTSICYYAFYNTAYYNNSANWEDGVLYIGNHLIEAKSDSLPAEYSIKAGTKVIAEAAFYHCDDLTSIEIPASVTSIGNQAFSKCYELASVTFGEDSQLKSIGDGAFVACYSLTSIHIPAGVTNIGDWAFYSCTKLTNIEIPAGVTSIGELAFYYCESLEYLHIPASVTNIGDNILENTPAYICSDSEICYAKEYADSNGYEFKLCSGHDSETPPHSHSYNTFSHNQAAHPHYAIYKCTCGDEQVTSEKSYNLSCDECIAELGEPEEVEIEFTPKVTSYAYKAGTSLEGLQVLAKFPNGQTVDITEKVTVTGFDTTTVGTKTATVTYKTELGEELTAEFEYTVSYTWWQWIIRILLLGIFWY